MRICSKSDEETKMGKMTFEEWQKRISATTIFQKEDHATIAEPGGNRPKKRDNICGEASQLKKTTEVRQGGTVCIDR